MRAGLDQVGGHAEEIMKRPPGDAGRETVLHRRRARREVAAHADAADGDPVAVHVRSGVHRVETRRRRNLHVEPRRQPVQPQYLDVIIDLELKRAK